MKYASTRDNTNTISAAEAIVQGISRDGGLFLPTEIPQIQPDFMEKLLPLSYEQRAVEVLSLFLTDFTRQELADCCAAAYGDGKFGSDKVAPVVKLDEKVSVLELYHGPTCAFKDFALQILPHLLTRSLKKTGTDNTVAILVATSGDTGKAALAGFADVPGTKICVFYPHGGVSDIQRLQMVTQKGENVNVLAVKGNFDDCQTGVKTIFADDALRLELEKAGVQLSSANSINWGRLVPQIVYYFHAYCEMVAQGTVKLGDKINVCVPTGNFGNILAAYFAREMGLPVHKFLCASNKNQVLTDFIRTGVYDRRREFYLTASPSMDILISSNLERLVYLLAGRKDGMVRDWMSALKEEGVYRLPPLLLEKLQGEFYGGCADDIETAQTILSVWKEKQYLADTHTAVALGVCSAYQAETGDDTPTVVASTASPYKFGDFVLRAAFDGETADTPFAVLERLESLSSVPMPTSLSALREEKVRFQEVIELKDMSKDVKDWLTK